MTDHGADLLIRAAAVHTLVPGQDPQRALAVRGDRIVALSSDPKGLDAWVTARTRILDLPRATVLPAFDDTHTHLIFAGHSAHDVPVHRARTIPEFLELIRERAATTPEGQWIRTTANWQELNLAERRLPTAAELDQATERHPVLVKRGGHNDVVNSCALRLAGITEDTPVPAGGVIGRDADGRLNGRLIDNALGLVERLVPAQDRARRVDGLRLASGQYAATGIGTVRDCAVSLDDYAVLLDARDAGALSTRVRALISAIGLSSAAEVDDLLDAMEDWRHSADPWLGTWGVKFGLDGGLEAGATEEPYACDHTFSGTLTWEPDALVEAVEAVVRRGWRVGTHAYGDRAVRILLDVYERVLRNNPGLPGGTLVMEHGGLAGPEQPRAVALGVPVTIQQPLLHDTAEVEREFWGPERVAALFPARGWLDQGALVTAGSDYPVGQFGAMRSVWGMTTRQTVIGVQGPQHSITYDEAIALHTTHATRLLGEDHLRGTLTPGRLADLTLWDQDPARCPSDALRDLDPTHTLLGGRLVHGAGSGD
ncbi:putative amidohydrolase YtcJ [Streptomyces griseochromogenes]|uniref:Amidohydrolase n=1 Tax=Streptomyces griseochromogenes TaxID=68214 RepID=A0A1B1B0U2_9ACTN|nr:amidohydrolase [Streptomyces griseochromogenes]ANP52453.1 amidohydrolase [Streptomyces griseochromogenes]MBP2055931.1 putative amidohydrolase YtcJ [Streptomyces griseochromogenes]